MSIRLDLNPCWFVGYEIVVWKGEYTSGEECTSGKVWTIEVRPKKPDQEPRE